MYEIINQRYLNKYNWTLKESVKERKYYTLVKKFYLKQKFYSVLSNII